MTWVKLDDQFFRNPKSVAAGKDGRELYLAGLCYCASQLTDGWIAQKALPLIAADAGVKLSQARVLESVGLWIQGPGGFRVHDYLKYNPSAKEVHDLRAKKAAAGAKGGSTKARNRLAGASGSASSGGTAEVVPPYPYPIPNPEEKELLVEREVILPDLRLERGLA